MPLSDHSRMVTCFAHQLWQGRSGRVEESPIAFGILPDDSGRSDQVGITACHQRGAGGGTDRAIGIELVEAHARAHELVDGRGLDVLPPKEDRSLYPRSSTRMQMIFGFLAALRAEPANRTQRRLSNRFFIKSKGCGIGGFRRRPRWRAFRFRPWSRRRVVFRRRTRFSD